MFEENFGETKMAPRQINRAVRIAVKEISNQQEDDTPTQWMALLRRRELLILLEQL